MSSRFHPILVVLTLAALTVGSAALAYAWWSRPLVEADRARAAGQVERALDSYRASEQRIARLGAVARLFAPEQQVAAYNQLELLYRARAYDAVVSQAASAPPEASPRFWSGTALLSRALDEQQPEARLVWLARAEDDLKQALQAAPDDWDTRFNYEVAARLSAGLRRQPQPSAKTRLQLLRPQPPQQPIAPRRVG